MASILIVEDDNDLQEIMKRILLKKSHQVFCAKDGKVALHILDTQRIDLLITDIIMPEMDGYELISTLRNQSSSPKIIAISGGAHHQEGTFLLDIAKILKADKVLQKPLDYSSINDVIMDVLGTQP